jgi:RND family efflux transporter MFP subunit
LQEQDLWQQFAEAATSKAFCESWLSLQAGMLRGTRSALLLLGTPDTGPFSPAAIFPDATYNVTHLAKAAERALRERRGLLLKNDGSEESGEPLPPGYQVAYPIEVSGKIHGAVVVETEELPPDEIQALMRRLYWGAGWLEVMLRRADAIRSQQANESLQKVLDTVAGAVEHEKFRAAAMGFVNGLAATLQCDRVSVGFVDRKNARAAALSHTAEFDTHTNVVRAIEAAMDEAIDQQAVILYPMVPEGIPLVTRAHQELVERHGAGAICTAPLGHEGKLFGALILERPPDRPFDGPIVELIKTVAALVGPILEGKRRDEKWLTTKAAETCVREMKKFVGPGHFSLKIIGIIVLAGIIFFTFAKGVHRVKAPTVLEGIVQRAVGAPFNGYIMEAPARPGDVVRQGDLLCRMDDREMKLERLKWFTQREQFFKQYHEATAKHDRAQALINEAKADQAEAQVFLLDEQLSRARITAPFEGIVTSGDFSQSLGVSVERGQTLFEVAPLRGYRVVVQVDERDIGWVAVGQTGELALPSIPGTVFPLTVTRITPISTAKEGRNYFRVEAELKKTSERLRPGMEGVGKIFAGRARLIWIWTHDVIEWISLKVWTWRP